MSTERKRLEDQAERLGEALTERLEDPRDIEDFEDLPASALIARICADLGIEPDWSLWEDEDWAVQETQDRVRGSPFAAIRSAESRHT